MSKIPLRNKDKEIVDYCIVDEENFEMLNKCKWYLSRQGYVKNSKRGNIHRFLLDAKKEDLPVDHINNNKLDNRKINLRFASLSQNAQNKNKKENCSSSYKGVSFFKNRKDKWRVSIKNNFVHFSKEEHAAYWYDHLVTEQYGKDAKINGIKKPEDFVKPNNCNKIRDLPTGVYSHGDKYKSIITINNKCSYIGTYDTIEEASLAFNNKKNEQNEKILEIKRNTEIKRNSENIAIILANNGAEILVDDDKYHDLFKYKCTVSGNYFSLYINGKSIFIHRYLLDADDNDLIDHINNNTKDNRILNLRKADHSLNSHNRNKQENKSSIYIGVVVDKTKKKKKYRAKVSKNGVTHHVGYYNSAEEAAIARDNKAKELYKDNAKLNF